MIVCRCARHFSGTASGNPLAHPLLSLVFPVKTHGFPIKKWETSPRGSPLCGKLGGKRGKPPLCTTLPHYTSIIPAKRRKINPKT